MTIIVVQGMDNYRAYLESNPGCWGAGKNSYEAIGNLISAHPEMFQIKIVRKQEENPKEK